MNIWPIYALLDLFAPTEPRLKRMTISGRYVVIIQRIKAGWYAE